MRYASHKCKMNLILHGVPDMQERLVWFGFQKFSVDLDVAEQKAIKERMRPMSFNKRLASAFMMFIFGAAILNILIPYMGLPVSLRKEPTSYLVALVLLSSFAAFFLVFQGSIRRRLRQNLLLAFAIIFTLPFVFTQKFFGTRDVGSMLITASENKLGEMVDIGIGSFGIDILIFASNAILILILAHMLSQNIKGFKSVLTALSLIMLFTNPMSIFAYRLVVPNYAHSLIDPDIDLLPPNILKRPDQQKNLIIVYLESLERTYREIPETAIAFKDLGEIEDRGISARNQMQFPGVNFTIGGIVGSQCGVPLLPRGIFSVHRMAGNGLSYASPFTEFIPSITCLGDVLSADGYEQSYLNGSDIVVFSKGDFFLSHGFENVFGQKQFENWETELRKNIWGLDDDVLFEKVNKELQRLASTDRPFTLVALTLSTHFPDAFLDKNCPVIAMDRSLVPDAIRCTGNHLKKLLAEVDKLGISEDTVIVFMSDHLTMKNTMWKQLVERSEQRRNLFIVLGAGAPRVIERESTTLDIYPTILEALGYKIEGGRAYMGRSIFSENGPTMIEKFGPIDLSKAVVGNNTLQEFIWK